MGAHVGNYLNESHFIGPIKSEVDKTSNPNILPNKTEGQINVAVWCWRGGGHAVTAVGWGFMELGDRSQLPVVPLWHSTIEDEYTQNDEATTQQTLTETYVTSPFRAPLTSLVLHIIFKQIFCPQTFKIWFEMYRGWKKCLRASEQNISVHPLHSHRPVSATCWLLSTAESTQNGAYEHQKGATDDLVCACLHHLRRRWWKAARCFGPSSAGKPWFLPLIWMLIWHVPAAVPKKRQSEQYSLKAVASFSRITHPAGLQEKSEDTTGSRCWLRLPVPQISI